MEKELTGDERRKVLISIMREAKKPMSGSSLGEKTGVSRQVVVQDIALLRTQGYPITSTTRGYLLEKYEDAKKTRVVKVYHTNDQVEDELNSIVDLGGTILDVMVNHRAYGKMSAAINIKNRRDVQTFVENIKTGKSTPLLNVTSGYHFHRISAESDAILDEIVEMLSKKGYLSEVLSYEKALWD